ncbi:MAG TPA: large-conductance mechanosensitive channel protein MscL [Longimicrobiales bacterium]|nr:large-conductance mechanosensitive channel protein MscL [Longimicrobiales bacterium]
MSVMKEFREFAVKGNVVDMAVGIIIGAAFGTIVKSLVDDVIMPGVGLLLGGVSFENFFWVLREGAEAAGPYATLEAAQAAGAVTVNYGVFINTLVSFLIVALAVFFLVRGINRLRREEAVEPEAPTDRPCPFCASTISIKAVRCPHCTSALEPVTT